MSEACHPPRDGSSEPARGAGSSIDEIIELYKRDVDRTLLREQLKKSASERLRDLQQMVRFLTELRERGERSRR